MLLMLDYCYWWMGSWLLEKWSHHVCLRILFSIVLRWRNYHILKLSLLKQK